MIESGFYKLNQDFLVLLESLGCTYQDNKARPIYCCIQDKDNPDIYWAIPTSDLSHRSSKQADRINTYCALPERDIRSCFYHIGHTDRPAIFKVSNTLPLTCKYVDSEYLSQGQPLVLKDQKLIKDITRKLHRILLAEAHKPNKFEQRITNIYNYLVEELEKKAAELGEGALEYSEVTVLAELDEGVPQYSEVTESHEK